MRVRSQLAAVSMATLLAAVPGVVAAHAELESSTPAAGDNVDTAPTVVTLIFDDELDPDGSSFTVVDAGGHEVGSGEVDLTVADRNVLAGDVTITKPGVYSVAYTVVGDDGHEVSGMISFGYDADEAIPEPTEEAPNTAMPGRGLPLAALSGWLLVMLAGVVGIRRLVLR